MHQEPTLIRLQGLQILDKSVQRGTKEAKKLSTLINYQKSLAILFSHNIYTLQTLGKKIRNETSPKILENKNCV